MNRFFGSHGHLQAAALFVAAWASCLDADDKPFRNRQPCRDPLPEATYDSANSLLRIERKNLVFHLPPQDLFVLDSVEGFTVKFKLVDKKGEFRDLKWRLPTEGELDLLTGCNSASKVDWMNSRTVCLSKDSCVSKKAVVKCPARVSLILVANDKGKTGSGHRE